MHTETAQVNVAGHSYTIEATTEPAEDRTATIPFGASPSASPWWSRLSCAALRELPQPPPGNPKDWVFRP